MGALSTYESGQLEALVAEFRPALVKYFSRRVYTDHEIEDLVQEVFFRLVRSKQFQVTSASRGYVFRAANSVLTDFIRRRAAARTSFHSVLDPECHEGEDFGPDRVLQGKQDLHRATAILLELPERTRAIFVLRRLEGMKYNDIAARIGVSVSAVEKHMQRAVAHLAERLKERL